MSKMLTVIEISMIAGFENATMRVNGIRITPNILLIRKTAKMYVSIASFILKTQDAKPRKMYLPTYIISKAEVL